MLFPDGLTTSVFVHRVAATWFCRLPFHVCLCGWDKVSCRWFGFATEAAAGREAAPQQQYSHT